LSAVYANAVLGLREALDRASLSKAADVRREPAFSNLMRQINNNHSLSIFMKGRLSTMSLPRAADADEPHRAA
jgi:hypothetical protein